MNKNLHRVIFNQSRGIRMVVQETASSVGKAGNASTQTAAAVPGGWGFLGLFTLKPIAAGFALLLGAQGGVAQIIADPSAPGNQRPTVLNSANGIPTINIQTPSAAGVSRNTYQQFDIGKNGAILNNSRSSVQTQIGGWIQGNPWLSNGTAKVILNEVNSAAQSRLMGTMEVAGQRADVIIANPSGLVVDGLSFINAAGVTLTTGRPVYGAGGSVDGLSVRGGQISIQGSGMDATEADYASILARAISVNAGVWAKDLRVTTGSNELAVDGGVQQIRSSTGGGQPQFALDVAQLGGMYAGKIFIVGTEAGLGVRNAGTLSASTQRLTLTVDGQLSNAGVIASNAAAELSIAAQGIHNSGTLSSQRDMALTDGGQGMVNSGNVQAGRQLVLQAGQLTNQSTGTLDGQRLELTAVNLRNDGSIQQTGSQDLAIATAALANTGSAAVLGATPVSSTTGGTGGGGSSGSGGTASGGSTGSTGTGASSPSTGQDGSSIQATTVIPEVLAAGSIQVTQSLENTGQLIANGATDVRVSQSLRNSGTAQVRKLHSDGSLDNSHGSLVAQEFSGTQTTFQNRSGSVFVQSDVNFSVQSMDNTSGSIGSAQALAVNAQGDVINSDGALTAGKNLRVQSQSLENDNGARIVSNAGSVQLDIVDGLNNHKGQIVAASGASDAEIRINATTFDNSLGEVTQNGTGQLGIHVATGMGNAQGSIVSNGSTQIAAGTLDNESGHISTLKQLDITAQQDIRNVSGVMQAGDGAAGFAPEGSMSLQAGGVLHNQNGRIFASGALQAQTHSIDNTTGNVSSLGAMDITASDAIHNGSGKLLADGQIDIRAGNSLDNLAGTISSADKVLVSTGLLDNTQGTIVAANDLSVRSTALQNQSGQIGAQSVAIDTQLGNLNNDSGKIIASQGGLEIQSGALSNDQGWIQAAQKAEIDTHAQQISNTGTVLAAGELHITSGDLDNIGGGSIQAGSSTSAAADLHITASGTVTNTGGHMLASAAVDMKAAQLDNSQGEIGAGHTLDIQAQTALRNSAGKLLGNTGVNISSGSLLNDQQGIVGSSAGDVTVTTGALENQTGTITAQGLATLTSNNLDNSQGTVAGDQVAINTQGHTLLNAHGQILASNGDLTIDSGELRNQQGRIAASQNAVLSANGLNNNTGRISASALRIQSQDTSGAWAAVSNQNGQIVASQSLQLDSGVLSNIAGAIQTTASGSALQIDSHGASISNHQSTATSGIVSAGTLHIDAQGGNIDNSSAGYIGAYGSMELAGERIANQGGNIVSNDSLAIHSSAVSGIGIDNSANGSIQSTTDVQLHASTAEINNTTGSILANNDLLIQSKGVVNNTQGFIKAGHQLAVLDTDVASGAALASATQTLSNQGGTLFAANNLQIKNRQLTGAGNLQSQGSMQLAFANSYTHQGSLSVNQDLSVESAGDITNLGTITGGDSVTVTAQNVDNLAGAEISSAGVTTVNASQALNNRGLIDGRDTRINAGAVNNIGTGRIYGDHVSIAAGTVTNRAEGGVSATIAARQALDIGSAVVYNMEESTILSLGDIRFGAGLDANRNATGQAQAINNTGAKIDAAGNIDANVLNLNNNNAEITISKQVLVETRALENLVQVNGNAPDSASKYVELWDGEKVPSFGWFFDSGFGFGSSDGRLYKPAHPDKFLTMIPAAYIETKTCIATGESGGCDGYTYSYWYEPAGSVRFEKYGVALPEIYNVNFPNYFNYGARYYSEESGPNVIYWPPGSNKAGYEAALIVFNESVAAAKRLNDLILAENKENNRIEGSWRSFTQIYNRVEYTYRDIVLSSKPGSITAGGNLSVSGSLNNIDSSVIVGGSVIAGALNNKSTEKGVETKLTKQTASDVEWSHDGGIGGGGQERDESRSRSADNSQSTTFELPTFVFVTNQTGVGGTSVAGNSNTGNNVTANATSSNGVGQSAGTTGAVGKQNTGSASAGTATSAAAHAPATVTQQPVTTASGQQVMVRTVTTGPSLPSSSLYVINALSGNQPLIETDPSFINYKNWLSSDYMLNALSMDPNLLQKRLGDGFYEQQLIQQQVAQLTGRRFLGDYSSNDEQYMALMQNGVTFAQEHGLRPGISLSAAQVAQLTSDLVWLVSENITMPDGSVQTVLVPKVYVVARPGDLSATGTLLSGDTINVQANSDVHNSGTIAGRRAVLIAANDINNIGGHIVSDSVVLDAQRDINVVGGSVSAALSLLAQAGNDINVITTTRTDSGGTAKNGFSNTVVDRVAGLSVTGTQDASGGQTGVMSVSAGRDINLQAAQISNATEGGATRIEARNNLNLSTVNTSNDLRITWDGKNHLFFGGSAEVGTQITTQGTAALVAGNDINARAAQVDADEDLRLKAGNNVNIEAGEASQHLDNARYRESSGMFSSSSSTETNKWKETQLQASSFSGNTVGITAGNDINVVGSSVAADTQLQLRARNDVNIVAGVETATDERVRKSSNSGFLSKSSSDANGWQSSNTAVGSGINGENVSIHAGRDIAVVGSEVNAMEQTILSAGRDVIITSAENTKSGASYEASKSSGFAFGKEGLGYSKGSQSTNGSHTTTTQSGSSVTGGEVTLNAGRDVTVQASTVVADEDLDIYAARNVNIVAGTNTFDSEQASKSKSTTLGGFIPTGLTGVTLFSNNKNTQDGTSSGTSAVASTVGSLGGNVNILAGERYTQTGSDVIAPQGDINIYAKTVEITEARETITESSRQSSSSTTLGARPSNAVVDLVLAAKDVVDTAKATADTGNSRVQAMGAAVTAYKAAQVAEAAVALAQNPSKAASISIEFQLGTSKSKSSSTQTSDTGRGSSVAAGGDVTIVASGAGSDSDIHVRGSEIGAGRNVNLKAEGDVLLESSQDKGTLESSNKSSGGSLGVGISFGVNTGITFSASVNGARGNADGNDVIQQNTHVVAGNTVTIQSGADTTLAGATVTAPTVKADVGGDLTIESRQDVSTFESQQKSFGAGVTLCIPPICYGASSVSVSGGKQNIDSNYQSVTEQSGIRAGDGGFQVNVAQDTTLVGGAITSSDQAVNEGKNSFNTGGTLTMSDIQNQAEYEGDGFSFNATFASSTAGQKILEGHENRTLSDARTPKTGGSAGYGEDSGSAGSVTTSGISGIAGNDAIRTGDAETGITPIFDKEKVQRELDAQIKITAEFGKLASKKIGDYAGGKASELRQQASIEPDFEKRKTILEDADRWEEGGSYRVLLHTMIGGLTGGSSGAAGAAASSLSAAAINELVSNLPPALRQAAGAAIAAGLGAAAGSSSGTAIALNVDFNNRQLHPDERKLARNLAAKSNGKYTVEQIENALRTAGNTEIGESIIGGMIVNPSDRDAIYDGNAVWQLGNNGKLVQLIPAQPGVDLIKFIQDHTAGQYDWYTASPSDGAITSVPRDRLTGAPLDEQGRYSQTFILDGKRYQPKYFSCSTLECMVSNANLDISDPGTMAYIKAMDAQIFKDISTGVNYATLITPGGVAGTVLAGTGLVASAGSALTSSSVMDELIKFSSQEAASKFITDVLLHTSNTASRINAIIDLSGGWDAFVKRVNNDIIGKKDEKK